MKRTALPFYWLILPWGGGGLEAKSKTCRSKAMGWPEIISRAVKRATLPPTFPRLITNQFTDCV